MLAEERRYTALKHTIAKRMEILNVSDKQMAAAAGCAPATFQKKKIHPERFTYPELTGVFRRLQFTDAEIMEAVR